MTTELNDLAFAPEARDIISANYEALVAIVSEHQFRCFTWPSDEPEYEPLLIDAQTASAMVLVHDGLGPDNQAKFKRMVKSSRGNFAKLVKFTWEHITLCKERAT